MKALISFYHNNFRATDSGYLRKRVFSFFKDAICCYARTSNLQHIELEIQEELNLFDSAKDISKNICFLLFVYKTELCNDDFNVLRDYSKAFIFGETTGGTVFCAESEWEQTRDYYADNANFTYYCGGRKFYVSEESGEHPQIDAQRFDELLAFGEEYSYKPFDERSNEKAMQIAYRLPEEAFDKGLKFTKVSNDGYFMTGGGHEYFVHEGKLILVFYHDGGRDNGGIREVVSIDVPDELGEYFIDLMERY